MVVDGRGECPSVPSSIRPGEGVAVGPGWVPGAEGTAKIGACRGAIPVGVASVLPSEEEAWDRWMSAICSCIIAIIWAMRSMADASGRSPARPDPIGRREAFGGARTGAMTSRARVETAFAGTWETTPVTDTPGASSQFFVRVSLFDYGVHGLVVLVEDDVFELEI
jgi:hypothetical protein